MRNLHPLGTLFDDGQACKCSPPNFDDDDDDDDYCGDASPLSDAEGMRAATVFEERVVGALHGTVRPGGIYASHLSSQRRTTLQHFTGQN